MKINLLILNAGSNLVEAYYTNSDVAYYELPIRELSWRDLRNYDIIIIPAWSDQDLLREHAEQLERFIEKGGIAIQFGCYSLKWYKFLAWKNDEPSNEAKLLGDASQVFRGIDVKFLQWHSEFVAHGYLFPKTDKYAIFAEDGNNHPIALSIEHGRGAAFFTTLDPDFHFITGSFILSDADKRNIQATILLRNVIGWGVQQFSSKNKPLSRLIRRFRGIASFMNLAPTFLIISILSLLVTITISTVKSDPGYHRSPGNIFSLVIGVIGLFVAISQEIRNINIFGRRR